MGHKEDWWEGLREWLIPKLGWITQLLEDITGDRFYVESGTHNNQFVGRVPMPEEEFEAVLHDLGFDRNPLAAWKHLESDPDNYEEASFRKVGFEDYPDMQVHVILYDGNNMDEGEDDHTYVYAHWELRWDKDPWGHYRGHEYSGPDGVRRMKNMLDEKGITYEGIRP